MLLHVTLDLQRRLENELADFYESEVALVFSTGYVANISTISGILNRHDYTVLDKDAHNSLLTGAQLSGATLKRFSHNNVAQLGRILADLPDAPEMAAQLRANVGRFISLLTDRGVPVNPAESAIITIPLRRRDEISAVVLARELLDVGVFVNPVVAPAVSGGLGLIRLSLMLD